MKKVILTEESREINVQEAITDWNLSDKIIAYRVSGNGKGLSILIESNGRFGFNYLRYLCKNQVNLKFASGSIINTISSAIKYGKNVIIFDSHEEMITYAEKIQ